MSSIDGVRPFVVVDDDVVKEQIASVIRVQSTIHDLSPIEVIEKFRPILAMVFMLMAICIVLRLSFILYHRYRVENFAPVVAEALDRRSVRRKLDAAIKSTS